MSEGFSFDLSQLGSSGFDFTGGSAPSSFNFQLPQLSAPLNISPTPGGGWLSSINNVADTIVGGAKAYYGTQAQIEQAKAAAAVAKAQGQNAVQVAQAGLPSPQLLLFGGLGLMGLLILTRKK